MADISSRAMAESAAISAGALTPSSPSTTAAAIRLRGDSSDRRATILSRASIGAPL